MPDDIQDLIVVGGSPAGLSVAVQARRAGLAGVTVLGLRGISMPTTHIDANHLTMRFVDSVESITAGGPQHLSVNTSDGTIDARVCLIDFDPSQENHHLEIPSAATQRVHSSIDFEPEDCDVLVVGSGDDVGSLTSALVERGARVALAFSGSFERLSLVARQVLARFEREQRATVLWQSRPASMWTVDGYPMVTFDDRRTPDLQFDHVVLGGGRGWKAPGIPADLDRTMASRLFRIADAETGSGPSTPVEAHNAWQEIRAKWFPESHDWPRREVADLGPDQIRELEARHYNATITGFDTAHNELWRIRVRPDRESAAHLAGQYCSLGIGYWEPRADDAVETALDSKRHKLIRRSYSISSPIFDEHGYLVDHAEMDEIELYIVWVRADGHRVPELTPRLALKHIGDRLYLGPKITGRYNLSSVTDPGAPILFCSTGTGEAPHNAMVVELLRKGHHGPILSAVSVRYRSDLAYVDEHRLLETRFDNYRYLPVPTRETDTPKRYLQEMLEDGTLEDQLGSPLDARTSHVFLCGNPKMIGLPEWERDEPRFGDETGMAELLHQRGFTLDRRGSGGNVHYEEYW